MHGRQLEAIVMLLLAFVAAAGIGCTRVNTVPAWKGIPAMVLAPNSLEAMAWHDGAPAMRAARRAEHATR